MFEYTREVNFRLPDNALDKIKDIVDKWRNSPAAVSETEKYRSDYLEIGRMLREGYVDNPYCTFEKFKKIQQQVGTLQDQARVIVQPVPALLKTLIVKSLPKTLQAYNPEVVIQIVVGGTWVQPHWDHNERTSSLFCLIEYDGADTIWYEPVAGVELDEQFRLVFDMNQIREVKRMCFQERKWYVFTHNRCHGVERHNPTQNRTAICIEFRDLPSEVLYNSFVL
jgi:hypothetical protein